jgi:zinc transporter 5/7
MQRGAASCTAAMVAIAAAGRAPALHAAREALNTTSTTVVCTVALLLATGVSAAISGGGSSALKHIQGRPTARAVSFRGVVFACAFWLFCYGLRLCGPMRAVVFDGSQVALAALVFPSTRSTASDSVLSLWRRGGLLLVCASLLLLVGTDHMAAQPEGGTASASAWHPAHATGEAALLLSAILTAGNRITSQRLARAVGGPRRLFTMTAAAGTLCLLLAMGVESLTAATRPAAPRDKAAPLASWLLQCLLFAVLGVVSVHHVDAAAPAMAAAEKTSIGLAASFIVASALEVRRTGHNASRPLLWLAAICMLGATRLLMDPSAPSAGGHVSGALLPTRALAPSDPLVHRGSPRWHSSHRSGSSRGLSGGLTLAWRVVSASRTSRRLALFLGINLMFMVVEALVGVLSHSLTLATDAAHMLLDCAALAVGLFGETAARWPPSAHFPFGFGRYEPLCGLINALLLLLVAISVISEAVCRLIQPPLVDDTRLMPVAIGGLLVNLVGMLFFADVHQHAGGSCTDGGGCGAARGGGSGENMRGVFLHVLADTMGSVATIVSSLLATHMGWHRADPVCSLLVAACIVVAALPLLRSSAALLLLRTPDTLRGGGVHACLAAVRALPHVRGVSGCRFWSHTGAGAVGLIQVLAAPEASERFVASNVERVVRGFSVGAVLVEVNKE